jgi:hypothetical protein
MRGRRHDCAADRPCVRWQQQQQHPGGVPWTRAAYSLTVAKGQKVFDATNSCWFVSVLVLVVVAAAAAWSGAGGNGSSDRLVKCDSSDGCVGVSVTARAWLPTGSCPKVSLSWQPTLDGS